jgi:hypothetical protein
LIPQASQEVKLAVKRLHEEWNATYVKGSSETLGQLIATYEKEWATKYLDKYYGKILPIF